jgi:Predicted membrane protein (DUF2306)
MREWLHKERGEVALVVVLLILNFVPIGAGIIRMWGMQTLTEENTRFLVAPLATVLHIVGSSVFGLVGIGQFIRRLRGGPASWHRRVGWILAFSGLISAISGLWMTAVFPHGEGDSRLLDAFRYGFGIAMTFALLKGMYYARKRSFLQHQAWMVRAYALGMGAGTQVVLFIPWMMWFAPPDAVARALILGAGWAVNLLLAEWWVSRSLGARGRRNAGVPSG